MFDYETIRDDVDPDDWADILKRHDRTA